MGYKAFLFLGLFLAIFVMISSEALARELAETSTISEEDSKKSSNKNEVHKAQNDYGGYPNGVRGGGGRPRGGYPVPGYPAAPGGGGISASGGGYPNGVRGGGHSRGGRGGGGRGGGGGNCRYGCCGRRNYSCSRCCSYKGEAIHG